MCTIRMIAIISHSIMSTFTGDFQRTTLVRGKMAERARGTSFKSIRSFVVSLNVVVLY